MKSTKKPFTRIVCGSFQDAQATAASESLRICGNIKLFAVSYCEHGDRTTEFHEVVDADSLNRLDDDYNVIAHHRYINGISK